MKFIFLGLVCLAIVKIGHAQETYLLIRKGGGVTGISDVYKIDLDGKVQKGKGLGEIRYTEESKLRKCRTKKYFRKVKTLLASYPNFNHPGNLYSSIAFYDQSTERTITWGDPQKDVPDDATDLYQRISTALSKLKFTPQIP